MADSTLPRPAPPSSPDSASASARPGAAPLGIVLAGGRSSRMGRDKAALRLGGASLLERARDALAACGCAVHLSGRADPVLPSIPDLAPGHGPAAAIVACAAWALRHAPGVPLLLLPVDLPGAGPALLRPLLDALDAPDHPDAVHYRRHPLPLALAPGPALQTRVADALARGVPAISVRALLDGLRVAVLEAPAARDGIDPLCNVNTPDEWSQALETWGGANHG